MRIIEQQKWIYCVHGQQLANQKIKRFSCQAHITLFFFLNLKLQISFCALIVA